MGTDRSLSRAVSVICAFRCSTARFKEKLKSPMGKKRKASELCCLAAAYTQSVAWWLRRPLELEEELDMENAAYCVNDMPAFQRGKRGQEEAWRRYGTLLTFESDPCCLTILL